MPAPHEGALVEAKGGLVDPRLTPSQQDAQRQRRHTYTQTRSRGGRGWGEVGLAIGLVFLVVTAIAAVISKLP